MFKELAPYLRQRAVLLTVTHIEEDQIRVNVIPQKLKDGENAALTTPLTVTGTAEELDRELPTTIVGFVSAHLQLRNTLDKSEGRDGCGCEDRAGRSPLKGQSTGKQRISEDGGWRRRNSEAHSARRKRNL